METLRTPDERFVGLPGYDFAPSYAEIADSEGGTLRVHYLREGEPSAPVVLLMHGEPSWSYLYRKMIPILTSAGLQAVAPDLVGFGRSDKPTDVGWYSYDRHTWFVSSLLEHLDLRGVTMVVHDWGGPIGLRIAVEQPDRVDRLVMMDTGLFTGRQRMSDAWLRFRDFVDRTEDLPVSLLVRGACLRDPGADVLAAYEAPFPNAASKAGARAFPALIPQSPDAPGADKGRELIDTLRTDGRPKLILWADSDLVLPVQTGEDFAAAIAGPPPRVIPQASHFLQEDQGEQIGTIIAEWLTQG